MIYKSFNEENHLRLATVQNSRAKILNNHSLSQNNKKANYLSNNGKKFKHNYRLPTMKRHEQGTARVFFNRGAFTQKNALPFGSAFHLQFITMLSAISPKEDTTSGLC